MVVVVVMVVVVMVEYLAIRIHVGKFRAVVLSC